MFDFGIFDDLGFDQEQADSTPVVIPHRIKSISAALTLPRIRLSLSASNPVPIVEIRISGEAFPYLIPRIITDRPPPPVVASIIPDWVPVNATTFADFVNGRYWDGVATVTDPSDMFKSDEVDVDPWIPAKIEVGVGYWNDSGEAGASYHGQALISITPEFVVVIEGELLGTDDQGIAFIVYDGTFSFDNTFNVVFISNNQVRIDDIHGDYATDTPVVLGINRIAARFSSGALALSMNGRPLVSVSEPYSPTPMSMVTFYTSRIAGHNAIIRSVTTYPNSILDADLPALSAIIPPNAKIHIDLVNRFAWTEVDGFVAIDTLLGSDPNTVNGWGATEYNPADLTADGLVYTTNPPAFLGEARSKVLDAATMQIKFKCLNSNISNSFAATAANGADALEIDLISATSEFQFESWGGAISEEKLSVVNSGNGAINVLAFTLTSTRLEAALNGTDAITATLLAADRPAANPLVTALVDAGGSGHTALQSITIYDALADTAGLSALSETGVTNTAPHDIISSSGLTYQIEIASSSATSSTLFFDNFSATDDEGNPLIFQFMASDAGSYIGFVNTSLNVPYNLNDEIDTSVCAIAVLPGNDAGVPPGDYHLTLRATDPGGLYVEQQFTITVTP